MRARKWLGLTFGVVLGTLAAVSVPAIAASWGGSMASGGGFSLAYLATQFLPLTGGTMTGQQVFSGVTTDISTGTNQDLTITPNGTGVVDVTTTLRASGVLDARSTISNTSAAVCFTGASSVPCVDDIFAVNNTAGNSDVYVRASSTARVAGIGMYDSSNTGVGSYRYWGSTSGDADTQDRFVALSAGKQHITASTTDIATGTPVWSVMDNTSGTGVVLMSVYGSGVTKWNPNTAAAGITCNAAGEGLEYVRVIAASNKSGKCLCTQTSSGVYAWTISYTGGGTALVAGDC